MSGLSATGVGQAQGDVLTWDAANNRVVWGPPSAGCDGSLTQTLYVDNAVSTATPDGSLCSPYNTIQEALDFVGTQAVDPTEFWVLRIANGAGPYTENLTVPTSKNILLKPESLVFLDGNVSWTSTTGAHLGFEFFNINGSLTISDGGVAADLNLGGDLLHIQEGIDGTGVTGGGNFTIGIRGGSINAGAGTHAVNAPTGRLDLTNVSVDGEVAVSHIGPIIRTEFVGGGHPFTVTNAPIGSGGFFNSYFQGGFTFSGPAESFTADGTSMESIERVNATVPNSTLNRFDDPLQKSAIFDANATLDAPIRVAFVNTPGGGPAITITLPAAPKTDDEFVIKDAAGNAASLPITIAGNGNNIDGQANATIATNFGAIRVKFNPDLQPQGASWLII